MRMGKELGIPTPYNEYTYHMIKAMEEKSRILTGISELDRVLGGGIVLGLSLIHI